VEGPCQHGNEPSGTVKCCGIVEQLYSWRPVEKGSAAWGQLGVTRKVVIVRLDAQGPN
jgi:hypothetical protein